MATDYYDTLGLKKGASEDEIRTAYRTMARKYHPDLNQGDEVAKKKFQEVQQAFDVLSDPKKREMYERFGPGFESMSGGPGAGPHAWPGAGGYGSGGGTVDFDLNDLFGGGAGAGGFGGGGGGGFADLFKQFSKGQSGGAGTAGARGPRQSPQRGQDIEHQITVPFATAIKGGEAEIGIQRADGKSETIKVKIPAGMENGKKIRLRGQGNPSQGGGADGDLLLTVNAAAHPYYKRRGMHLDLIAPITLAEAAAGAKIDIPTPKGTVSLTVPAGTSSGKRLRVKGHGVQKPGAEGDLFVELQLLLPEDLSEAEQQQLAEITGSRPANPRGDIRW